MTAPLFLALLVLQAPSGTNQVPGFALEPRLARGIMVEELAEVPAMETVPMADASGCLGSAYLCRHQAVVVEGGEFQPGRFGLQTVHRSSMRTGYQPPISLVGVQSYLVPPDCDTYSDCRMWEWQRLQNEEISREMRRIAQENRQREAAAGKHQRTCNTAACSQSTDTSQGGSGGARFGAGQGRASGGGSVGGGAMSTSSRGSGGTTYTSTSYNGGGGRTGSAKER